MESKDQVLSTFSKYIAESLEILELAGIEKKHLQLFKKRGWNLLSELQSKELIKSKGANYEKNYNRL